MPNISYEEIPTILSAYINKRDNAKKTSSFYVAGNASVMTMSQFSEMINAHHQMIAGCLPPMTLPLLVDFVELLDLTLRWMRVGDIRPEPPTILWFYDRIPTLNLAQMEAFTELMKSRMSWLRMQ